MCRVATSIAWQRRCESDGTASAHATPRAAPPRSVADMSRRGGQCSPAAVELTEAGGIAARDDVLTHAPLLSRIFDKLRGPDVRSAECVSSTWRRTVASAGHWRRITLRQFPSVVAHAEEAPTQAQLLRAAHLRRAHAEGHSQSVFLHEEPLEERSAADILKSQYRWSLELRDTDGATMLSASFHVGRRRAGPIQLVNSCNCTTRFTLHDTAPDAPRLNAERLCALAAQQQGGVFDGVHATLVVERHPTDWHGQVSTAVVLNSVPTKVCVHPEDGYALLTVGATCCETGFDGHNAYDEEFIIRRLQEDSEEEEEDDDFDNAEKWLSIKPAFILLLKIPRPRPSVGPEPRQLRRVREPQCWFNFLSTSGGVSDTTNEEMLTLLRALV